MRIVDGAGVLVVAAFVPRCRADFSLHPATGAVTIYWAGAGGAVRTPSSLSIINKP